MFLQTFLDEFWHKSKVAIISLWHSNYNKTQTICRMVIADVSPEIHPFQLHVKPN